MNISAGIATFDISRTANYAVNFLAIYASLVAIFGICFFVTTCTLQSIYTSSGSHCAFDCAAYNFTGDWQIMSPNPVPLPSEQAYTYAVNGAPGLQGDAEYWNVSCEEAGLCAQDCVTWDYGFSAIMICLRSASVRPNSFIAGISQVSIVLNTGMNVGRTNLVETNRYLSDKTTFFSSPNDPPQPPTSYKRRPFSLSKIFQKERTSPCKEPPCLTGSLGSSRLCGWQRMKVQYSLTYPKAVSR